MTTGFDFSAVSNIDAVMSRLTNAQKKKIPKALAGAMRETVELSAYRAQRSMDRYLDRPTPQAKRAIRFFAPFEKFVFTRDAKVFIAKYMVQELGLQIYGGVVDRITDKDYTIITPVNATKDNFGNVEGLRGRANVLRMARQRENVLGEQFLEVPLGAESEYNGLPAGLYRVFDFGEFYGRLEMMFKYESIRTYKPRWPFPKIVRSGFDSHFPKTFSENITKELGGRTLVIPASDMKVMK